MIRPTFATLARAGITLLLVSLAAFAAAKLWRHYQVEPWTPDGRVRADIVQVAPDVEGIVIALPVNNDQPVRKGQLLFQIDAARYALALRQAEANLAAAQARQASAHARQAEILARQAAARSRLAQGAREVERNRGLRELVPAEVGEQADARQAELQAAVEETQAALGGTQAALEESQAALAQAHAARDLAALNLQRTRVLAPTDGILSDLTVHVGNYVSVGKPVLGLIDSNSLHVEGYFEETRLTGVRSGAPARVTLMGDRRVLRGHVQSLAAGIEDRDRVTGGTLLPSINPTFSWVRLAQRVPVRIALDDIHDPSLIAGRTASVQILAGHGSSAGQP